MSAAVPLFGPRACDYRFENLLVPQVNAIKATDGKYQVRVGTLACCDVLYDFHLAFRAVGMPRILL